LGKNHNNQKLKKEKKEKENRRNKITWKNEKSVIG
jgi:hypothetical protein